MTTRAPSAVQRLQLPVATDERGNLCVAEFAQHVPFDVQRAYWITDVPAGATRGGHAHHETEELIVAASGRFVVHCRTESGEQTFSLEAPGDALLVKPRVWIKLDSFAPGSVCVVLASTPYTPRDYTH